LRLVFHERRLLHEQTLVSLLIKRLPGRQALVGSLDAISGVNAPGYDKEGQKESDRGNGEYGNGATEAGAYLRSGAGGGVAAHAAALCVGAERADA
jgi:hypothetical protein